MSDSDLALRPALEAAFGALGRALDGHEAGPAIREVGLLTRIGNGIATVAGLPGVQSQELLRFPADIWGLAFNVDRDEVGVVLLDESEALSAGAEVRRTGRVLDTPVGEALLGRVVDPLGRPLDGQGPVAAAQRLPVEREPRPIMHRAPVTVPLQTGLKVVDALIPIGRGQRELILGDRQSGKTAIALDTILNQADKNCLCIYCACGKRAAAVANVVGELRERGALDYCLVVVATEEDPPGWQFVAPYAATTMGEFFMEQGRDVLVVYDDLTRHARAYRELSLLLRRPPGREAYPGDIFYIHSRLLERATHLRPEHGGGSLSALPIIETEDQNVAAYIPTNLISITDGQIYLTPDLFRKGVLPAVDVGESVSRVGGKTQLPAYRAVAGDLRLAYAQFEELEAFARFGTRLDPDTRRTIERGRRVREALKQPRFDPLPVPQQIAVLVALNAGLFDRLALDDVARAQEVVREAVRPLTDLCQRILAGEKLTDADQQKLLDAARAALDQALPPAAKEDAKEQEEAQKPEGAGDGGSPSPQEPTQQVLTDGSAEAEDQERPRPPERGADHEGPGGGEHRAV